MQKKPSPRFAPPRLLARNDHTAQQTGSSPSSRHQFQIVQAPGNAASASRTLDTHPDRFVDAVLNNVADLGDAIEIAGVQRAKLDDLVVDLQSL